MDDMKQRLVGAVMAYAQQEGLEDMGIAQAAVRMTLEAIQRRTVGPEPQRCLRCDRPAFECAEELFAHGLSRVVAEDGRVAVVLVPDEEMGDGPQYGYPSDDKFEDSRGGF